VRDPEQVIGEVGRRVAELRAQRGMTQAQFAEKLGLTQKHLQKIELGQLNMTIRTLVRLADRLDAGIGELFEAPTQSKAQRGRPPKKGRP